MKSWINKLVDQLDFDWGDSNGAKPSDAPVSRPKLSEELATIVYILDQYNKHLFETEKHPIRKTRNDFDEFTKMILKGDDKDREKSLFNFRKYFSTYRIDEVSYIHQTFDDFKSIIWDFVDQLSGEFREEGSGQSEVKTSFENLKDAVEADNIDGLRSHSREFIDCFIEFQSRKDSDDRRRRHRLKQNLDTVREKLVEANDSMRRDHLTGAFNRKSFDEKVNEHWRFFQHDPKPICLLTMDIDHFKKVNDTYGHAVGDFVLVECVKLLQDHFNEKAQVVSRVGGEEFTIILPETQTREAEKWVAEFLEMVRREVIIEGDQKIKFTMSCGIAELCAQESLVEWMKRSDDALYEAKESGRDRYIISPRLRVSKSAS